MIRQSLNIGGLLALSLLATSVHAANVELYGQIDVGLDYAYTSVARVATADLAPGVKPSNNPHATQLLESKNKHFSKLGLRSGMNSPSWIGLRGTEDLGNGWQTGFVLENGFNVDDGAMTDKNRLFNREASVFVKNDIMTLRFGRLGMLRGGAGSTGLMKDNLSAFGIDGWGSVQGLNGIMGGEFKIYDNVIALEVPMANGFKLHAMYTGNADTTYRYNPNKAGHYNPEPGPNSAAPTENKSDADRYFSAGVSYKGAKFSGTVVGDYMNWSNHRGSSDHGARPGSTSDEYHEARDFWSLTALGAIHQDDTNWFIAAQYFESAQEIGGNQLAMPKDDRTRTKVICYGAGGDGYNLTLGVAKPLAGGTIRGSVGYLRAETNKHSGMKWGKMNRYILATGYEYPFSKRTKVYGGVSYMHDSYTYTYTPHGKYFATLPDAWEVGAALGIKHTF